MVERVAMVTSGNGEVVRVGSWVRIQDADGEEVFVVVPDQDADASVDRVSADSPLGHALLGRRLGEHVRFRAPGGIMGVTVVAISGSELRRSQPTGRPS